MLQLIPHPIEPKTGMASVDILPSKDAEELVDFTCASPWERLALDIELELRSWGLYDGQQPTDQIAGGTRRITSDKSGGSSLSPPPITCSQISLGDKLFSLELRVSKHPNHSLDAYPLERLLGVHQCVMLTAATPDGIAADDASDASVLLSAMSVAASACACAVPMIVPVGRPSSLRFVGRQVYPNHLRFSCDYTHQISEQYTHLAGLLTLFRNKRRSAQRRNPAHTNDTNIAAKFTYNWTDFSLKLAAKRGTFLSDRQLAAVQLGPLSEADPVIGIRVTAIWDEFAATALKRNTMLAGMPASTAARLRITPASVVSRAIASGTIPVSSIPMSSAAKANLTLAQIAAHAPDGANAAAPRAVIDVEKSIRNAPQNRRRLSGNQERSTPASALDDYLVQVGDYAAAAAIQDASIDEEFVTSAIATLFEVDVGGGIMDQVVEALGPNAAELTTLERVARLVAVCESVNAAQKLWNLFLDGVQVHWEQGWTIGGVPFNSESGPDQVENLLLQKLQMINCCVERRRKEARSKESGVDEKGRKRLLEGVELVANGGEVWEPSVQAHPLATRDMVDEELKRMVMRAEQGEGSDDMEVKRQSVTLKSDMMAFKAANGGASMGDFVRWFSPSDWVKDETEGRRGGRLSGRMSRAGNIWEELWKESEAIAAHKQMAVFDAAWHGDKALGDVRGMSMTQVLLHLCMVQAGSVVRILQGGFGKSPSMKGVLAKIEQARLSIRQVSGNVGLDDLDMTQMATVTKVVKEVCIAEYCGLIASSVMMKLPPSDGMGEIVDHFACGASGEVVDEGEKEVLIRTAGLDDGKWTSILLPEWREFVMKGGDDRMYGRLSREEFRVAFRLGLDYGI